MPAVIVGVIVLLPGLFQFCSSVCVQYNTRRWKSNACVYYTERKWKNKNGEGEGGSGNKATGVAGLDLQFATSSSYVVDMILSLKCQYLWDPRQGWCGQGAGLTKGRTGKETLYLDPGTFHPQLSALTTWSQVLTELSPLMFWNIHKLDCPPGFLSIFTWCAFTTYKSNFNWV